MLGVVILTKNEENNIIDCLESVSFADEIIIVDDFSSDRTLDIIRDLKNKKIHVYKRKLDNDFSSQRNFGISKAKGEWILFVDADERVSEQLGGEILSVLSNKNLDNVGFYIKRSDVIWGEKLKHGESGNIQLLRLAKKGSGSWAGKVHETWKIDGEKLSLNNELVHFPHKNERTFLKEINYYTTLRAEELYSHNIKTNAFSIIIYPVGKFIYNFIINFGFLDKMPGFVFAVNMSFHSFLVRGKLWLLWKKRIKKLFLGY